VNLLRAREGGAINFISHDPITLGASCFDPEKHWGPNVTAFAAVPVDKSRDNEPVFKNVKPLHSDKVLAIDPRSRKVTTIEEVQKTGHFRRKPIRNKLINENCRCGEPFNPESAPDWKARIGSGIPFEIVFSDGVNGANPKPEVVPGVAYTVEKAGDKILLTGPIPEPNLSASMEGAFWSFSVWPHRRGKRNHKGRKARHFLPVDQKTGIITAALSGGRGTYKIRYHQGEEQIGPVIATSKKSLRGLKLTKDARKLGWKLAGPKLTPPPDVLQKLLTETSESEISQDDFDKNLISIKGVKLLFSADGRLSTPDGAIAVGELKAGKVPVFQGGATTKITHHPFPLTSRFKRRFFHRFAQVLKKHGRKFETTVETNDVVRVTVAFPHHPRWVKAKFAVKIDGKKQGTIDTRRGGGTILGGDFGKGSHKVEVQALVFGHGPLRHNVEATVTIEVTEKRDAPLKSPLTGAQPTWAYKVDGSLKDVLVHSVIYPCPGCHVTVHEEDADCWACGEKLEQRDLTEGWIK
jgi:hypothetical protein